MDMRKAEAAGPVAVVGSSPLLSSSSTKTASRVEPVAGPPSSLEKVGAAIGAALQKRGEKI